MYQRLFGVPDVIMDMTRSLKMVYMGLKGEEERRQEVAACPSPS